MLSEIAGSFKTENNIDQHVYEDRSPQLFLPSPTSQISPAHPRQRNYTRPGVSFRDDYGRGQTFSLSCTCIPVSEVRVGPPLRSDPTVHRTKARRFGPGSFNVSGPGVWNSLPEDIRNLELSLERF